MNREIKFRAWDKTYSLMNYKVQVGNTDYADPNYTCNSIWVDYGDNKSIGWMNADDKCIDLMQFTGLLDIKDNEIYEGDLLNIGATEFGFITNDKGENVTYEVKVEGCDYILYRTDLKLNWGRLSRLEEMNWNCQVVGNVHETMS
jgi:hypothetical protein